MSARARSRTALTSLWLALLVHGALLGAAAYAGDDHFAACAALVSFAFATFGSGRWLGLSALSPAMVYLYVLGCFHLGLAGPWAVGLASEPLPDWFLQERLAPALSFVIAAVGCYHAGLAWAVWRHPEPPARALNSYHNTVMYYCGMGVMVLGVVSLALGLRALGFDRVRDATYFDVYRLTQTYDPRLFATSLQVAPMGLYLAVAAAPLHRLRWALLLGGLWMAGILVLGFRGFALAPAATTVAVLYKRGLRPTRWTYVAAAAAFLVAAPAIKNARDYRLADRGLEDFLLPERPFAALEEMGGSLRPLVYTLNLMENEELRWGRTYLRSAAMVAPNLSSDWTGAEYVPVEEMSPSHWVTRLASPWHYQNHGGFGFSAVAEPYMNFGPVGVPVLFFGLAGALVWADRMNATRPLHLAAWAMLLGPLLWTTRNTSGVFFRPAVWGLLVALAAWQLSRLIAQTGSLRPRLPHAHARTSRKRSHVKSHLSRITGPSAPR